ncbi:TonB-dependent receptor [Oceanicoccus sp. KOV_DT_Chl]|uniref:TonB-dependent receptor n=1 Tax=Oceanicoccus sp. KOV_DT_Chl TaxID=1904639 RepID=UPI000C7C87C5|nr:TonB-dependent receptor [Oceanicoccus sp. KOV_DT_Chl]
MKKHLPFQPRLLSVAMLSIIASYSQAQSETLALEEVVVTAQKRAQSLQEVPISVVAYDSEKLSARGIDDLTDISASIPNLVVNAFNNDPGAVRLFMRGIGQNDVQLTQDPSVALYLDGVYIGSSFGSGFEGVDIERLEVLRGPQGTLYGRNATGGAVNIITKRANVEALEFRQDFTAGNLGALKSRTTLNIPLSDTVAAKVNYLISQRDGYVENKGPGADFGEEDRTSAVVDLRWQATQDLTIDYRFEQAEMDDSQNFEQVTAISPAALTASTTITQWDGDRLDSVTALREIKKNDLEITAHTLQADWSFQDSMTFKSITAYREFDNHTNSDPLSTAEGNGLPVDFAAGRFVSYTGSPSMGNYQTDFEQFSQEFQLIGNAEQLEYVAGLYYYQDEGNSSSNTSLSLGRERGLDITATENTSLALFGEATYTPAGNERWHITLGARYSEDNRKAERTNLNITPIIDDAKYDKDFTNFNPSLTVAFDLNDEMNVYAKVVSGFKSGGTSQRSANATLFADGFDEEEILSYEAGFKGDFWQQRVRLNMALFDMTIDGNQTSVQTGSTPGERDFIGIDDNKIKGVEVDLSLLLAEGLTLDLGYSYLDTELGEDVVDSGTSAGSFALIETFAYAPENSFTAALDYAQPLTNGDLYWSINYSYQDEFSGSVNQADNVIEDAYGLWGASVAWDNINLGSMDGHLKLLLWGKNLADEEYTASGGGAWAAFGSSEVFVFGDPRTYGLTVSYIY